MPDSPESTVFLGSSGWVAREGTGPVVTVGTFDGVHRGHRALVQRARQVAAPSGAPVVAYTFDPAPRDVLRPDVVVPRIQSLADRVDALLDAGADHVVVEPFDHALARMDAVAFALDVFGRRLAPTACVVGFDFRFGQGRAGDPDLLAATLGVPVHTLGPVTDPRGPISSSRVRDAVRGGDLDEAQGLLGRRFTFVGEVVHGDAVGRTIGVPTANLRTDHRLLPPDGVWAVEVTLRGSTWPAVMNLGVRPTFEGREHRVEVHLFGFDGDLYGHHLRVAPIRHLRPERAFPDVGALVRQIHADVAQARAALGAP